ncbi:hypothetical protein H0H87_012165 [Tephrocybe sp. NHM501043]|nr:hypothetical protein H0H87_012165 [Tephrocybe sp. NHM501043]
MAQIHIASPTPIGSNLSVTTLINGYGRTIHKEVTRNTVAPLAVINVVQNKRYRFRLIGLSCDAPFNFTIHNHTMKIIEADGRRTYPLTVDSLWVYAGQRYSVVVKASQAVDNYWIRADPLGSRGYPGFDNGRNSAILRYQDAPQAEPTSTGISTRPLNEDNLKSVIYGSQYPRNLTNSTADVVLPIYQNWHEDQEVFDVNGTTFSSPSVPVLLQILNGTYNATDLMPNGSVITLKRNQTVELQIHGQSVGGPHPWHLHGHTFWVIKNANSNQYNYQYPLVRDTVPTGLDGNITIIRFLTDNSGPWFFHCHIDWHIELGLAVVFAEDPEGTAEYIKPIPRSWYLAPFYDLCPAYDQFDLDDELLNYTHARPAPFGIEATLPMGSRFRKQTYEGLGYQN